MDLTHYTTVCDTPSGIGFLIDRMPDFFDTDPMDQSLAHVHTFYEIIWFREAGGTHTVDFQTFPIEANSLFFLSPGQVHHFDGVTRHQGLLLKFCTDFLSDEKTGEDIFIKYDIFNAFDAVPYCTIREDYVVSELLSIISRMQTELTRDGSFGHLEMLRSLVRIFLILVHRYGRRQDAPQLSTTRPSHLLFVRFRQLLEQNFTHLHAVSDYAEALHVSTKTLSNSIAECSGKAPLAFINDRILLEAKRLLRFPDMRVREVGYQLGFDDPSYFVKFFKRGTGFLPSDFKADTPSPRLAVSETCEV